MFVEAGLFVLGANRPFLFTRLQYPSRLAYRFLGAGEVMIAVVSLFVTLTFSLLVNRIATVALMMTGPSYESAHFQARSAFTGVGFTTAESESIKNHPVRRRIVALLMLLGNIGIATVVATLMASLTTTASAGRWVNFMWLGGGLLVLLLLARSEWVERQLNGVIEWALEKWTTLDVRDYVALLNLARGYAVTELMVDEGDWLADKSLIELGLPREGVLILGIARPDGTYLGAPVAATQVHASDTLTLYGPLDRIRELDERRSGFRGDIAHRTAQQDFEQIVEEEARLDPETVAVE